MGTMDAISSLLGEVTVELDLQETIVSETTHLRFKRET
jgi:hypothetical protein